MREGANSMMLKLESFDYAAIILLVVLLFSLFYRRMTKGIANHMFILVLATMVFATLFDIWSIFLDNSLTADKTSLYIAHSGYLFVHNLTTPAYVLYVISLTDTWHKLKKSILQQILLIAPISIVFILLVVNTMTDSLFYVKSSIYHRGTLFPLLYVIAGFYMALGLFYMFRYRKLLTSTKIFAISAIVPLNLIAIVIQIFYPSTSVEMFAGALSLLFVSMTAQRPEDLIDPFTGLGNYGYYADNVKRSFNSDKNITIVMLNISNFAALQAMISYESLSELLKSISLEIENADKEVKGHADNYYLDRGRFRMVFYGRHREKAAPAAEMLNKALQSNLYINDLSVSVNQCLCVVRCPEDINDFKALSAFGASFNEQHAVPGKVLLAEELFKNNRFDMLNNIDGIIDNALKNNKFKVYYQPIFSVEQNKFTSAEALLRLIDDKYGFIPPDVFIGAAEKSGAIHKIGDFVLEEVCRFIASDRFKQLGLDYIEINLSVAQCMHGDLADKILETLTKYNIPSDKINLEITETAASYAQNIMKSNLDKLSGAGVSFSLDDYGTGYSNMRRVIQLPLKIVKLDKSFVDEQNNPKMWIVLQNTVKMLKDMDMEIVVEGIETQHMAEQFAALNCDFIQGYYYSKPIPEDDFVEFISEYEGSKVV